MAKPGVARAHAHERNGDQPLSTATAQRQAKVEDTCQVYQVRADCFVYRAIIVVLGAVVLLGLGATFYLTLTDHKEIPDIFLALGSGAVGALAGLLSPAARRQSGNSPG
jgi:hypothetical protein